MRIQNVLAVVILLVGWALLPGLVVAAPFLVSDPYPATGGQPDSFVISETGKPDVTIPASINQTGLKYFRWDLAELPTGRHDLSIKAKNMWGVSSASPFGFTKEPPADLQNMRIVEQ